MQQFEVKNVLMMDLLHLIDWITFYQLFGISFWWHTFTEENPLVSKWYNAKFKSVPVKKQTPLYLG